MRTDLFFSGRRCFYLCRNTLPLLVLWVGSLLFSSEAFAQITLVGSQTTTKTASGTTALTIAKPTGLAVGDVMFASVAQTRASSSAAIIDATASGWTEITGNYVFNQTGHRCRGTLLAKVADASDVAATAFNFDVDDNSVGSTGAITAFRGVDVSGGVSGTPFDVSPGTIGESGSSTALAATSITTSTVFTGVAMFTFVGDNVNQSGWGTATSPALTEIFDVPHDIASSTLDNGIGAAWGTKNATGATGQGNVTLTGATRGGAVLIAMRQLTSISTGTVSAASVCQGGSISVPYTISGNFAANNTFTAQLSNASGSFASPTSIGTLANTNASGTINATIPTGQAAGTGYRIRVISNQSARIGSDNGSNIAVIARATVDAGSNITTCANTGSVIIGTGATTANSSGVQWTSSGTGTFTTPTSLLNAAYTPSPADVTAGSVTLTVTSFGNSPCGNATDSKTLIINPIPVTTSVAICQGGSGALTSSTVCPAGGPNQNTGAISAGAAANLTGTGSAAWSNPGNIVAAGTPYATATTGLFGSTNFLYASNFGFSIPAGSIIVGIQVSINRQSSGNNTYDNDVRLVKGGATTGSSEAIGIITATYPTSMGVANYGGTSDLWGATLTVADVNASNFGVAFSSSSLAGRTISVDYIRMTVTYTPPGAMNWYTVSSGGTAIGTGLSFNPVGVANSGIPNNTATGVYTFYAECATVAGCRTPTTFTINALPTVSISNLAASYCAGSSAVTINGNHAGGTFSGPGITDNGNGTASFNPTTAGIGNHSVTYSYNDGTCPNSTSQNVAVLANTTYYADLDLDTYGNLASTLVTCFAPPAGYVTNSTDCNDNDATMHTTFAFYVDADEDGFGTGALTVVCAVDASTPPIGYSTNNTDCDDTDAAINTTFGFFVDGDGDGFGSATIATVCAIDASTPPIGYSLDGTDCNDANPAIHEEFQFYVDADLDTYGTGSLVSACAVDATTAPSGYSTNNTDCNDALAAVNPGQSEVPYNGLDDNCVGGIDEGMQLLSQVLPSQCGTTLTTINSVVGAVSYGAPVNGYRFKVVNTSTNVEQIVDRPAPHFQLTMLPTYDYATTYSISVELRRNGIWLGYYGPSCLVSTPAILDPTGAAQVSPSQCGQTLASISSLIATTSLANVTAYRFKITNISNPATPNPVQTLDRSINWFSLTMLAEHTYGTTYMVEVAVKTNGVFSGFGSPCQVSTPAVPMIANCGATIATKGTIISTTSLNRVVSYRFEVADMTTFQVQTIDRSQNWFTFNMVASYTAGGPMAVRVAVQTAGVWSDFSEACVITAPAGAREAVKGDDTTAPDVAFRAVSYPNPYSEAFALDVDLPTQDKVSVKVYDMIGKLVETREFAAVETEMQTFGTHLAAGVYNVIVVQGEHSKAIRVVKR
ncbi:MopE-related protein [Flavobacterium sp.]|uniref:MopE-related protein n=1 Tax=Flavobacterium sp. TaxID=239 RepID=UPI0025C0E680|nr:MopE-related protein [Flavobacterium sp.]